MRFYLTLFLLLILAIVTLPITLIGMLAQGRNKKLQYKMGRFICVLASKIFYKINGARVTVKGLENIPKDMGGLLFAGNHKSLIDIPLLLNYVDMHIAFVGKSELKKVPFISQWMSLIGCLFLDRSSIRQGLQTILDGIQKLKDGESLVIFPEGTRGKTKELLPFKQGSFKLATKSNAPIIPFAIKGTNQVFEDNGLKLVPNNVYLTFGKPIFLEQLSAEDRKNCGKYVENIVRELYLEMN
jgi:1-acyl-sn-glycerol-3-phosphate acyltransferase